MKNFRVENFIELKILFRGTKKPGTANLSLGGGQNTKTVPGWWTKNFFEKIVFCA